MRLSRRYDDDDSSEPEPRDASMDQGRSTLDRCNARLDVVACLLERRQFHADMKTDRIAAINLQTDASPVTGAELQGMVAEFIHRDKTVRQTILPGSTLHYGHCDAIAKAIALVWAVWLICGPSRCISSTSSAKSVV